MKGIENFKGVENRSEADIERIENVKHEVRNALVMTTCADIDGFQECMMNWLDQNEELFEVSFDRLLGLKSNLLDEWESADPKKRDEIIDIINGPIVGRGAEMDVAA